jgi:hypothetical protein
MPWACFGTLRPYQSVRYLPVILRTDSGIGETLAVVAHREDDLVAHEMLVHQVERQRVRHLADHHSAFVRRIGTLQHLTAAQGVGLRLVGFDVVHRHRLPSPGMVDDELRVDTEHLVEQFLVVHRQPRELAHRIDADAAEPCDDATAEAPEVGHRLVVPQLPAVAHLVELGNAHAVLVGRDMLGHHIHGHLAEIEVRADARSGGDARRRQHVSDHRHGQLMRRHLVGLQIVGDVGKDLVDGIDVDVLGRDVFEVDAVISLLTLMYSAIRGVAAM